MSRSRLIPSLLVSGAVMLAACSSDGAPSGSDAAEPATTSAATTDTSPAADDEGSQASSDAVTDTESPQTDEAPATLPYEIPDYSEEALEANFVGTDYEIPGEVPSTAIGAIGFSRFVYIRSSGGEVVPTFVEGPPGRQTRCQDFDKDCSYQELKELYESGADVPEYLNMDRDTLGELVGQLDDVNEFVHSFADIHDACARGYGPTTNQTANMGIHMLKGDLVNDFDPSDPKMVLFAREAGMQAGSNIGRCEGDRFVDDDFADDYVAVGAVFNVPLSDEHPTGFAGDIDNWHIHYNTCLEPDSGTDGVGSQTDCEAAGGTFVPFIPSWMMHAYVADGFEAQNGVFSMFNPSVWPVADASGIEIGDSQRLDGFVNAPILNFEYGQITAAPGEPIVFSNSDSVPHTVTAGSALEPLDAFDSGVLGTGQSYELSFDEAGTYSLFCALHPDMTAVVTVE